MLAPSWALPAPRTERIATVSFDTTDGLWTQNLPQWLEGHEAAVNKIIFHGTTLI